MIVAAGTIGCLCFIPGSHSYGFQEFRIKEMAFTGTVGIVLILQSDVSPVAYMAAYLVTGTICLSVMSCLAKMTQLCPSRGRLFNYHQTFFDVDLGYTVGWIYW
jgi:amino acid permease